MTTRLSLYNNALRICGERRLASLSENREPRRLLDEIWDDGALDFCLEAGQWKFAKRSLALDYDPSIDTSDLGGFPYAFEVPDDYVRTICVCSDPYFKQPILEYSKEAGFFFSDFDTLYLQYVSNDAQYGLDMSLWPETFSQFVSAYLATELAPRLKNGSDQQKIDKVYKDARTDSLSKDAMESPTKFPAMGSWTMARRRGQWTDRNRT